MELAFSIGINISEFWELTPYELLVASRGFSMRKKHEAEEYLAKLKNEKTLLVQQALLISRWVWKKEITQKDIEEALGEKKTQKNMTDEQMLAQAKLITRMMGGEVIDG